jgi:hypothetical protein
VCVTLRCNRNSHSSRLHDFRFLGPILSTTISNVMKVTKRILIYRLCLTATAHSWGRVAVLGCRRSRTALTTRLGMRKTQEIAIKKGERGRKVIGKHDLTSQATSNTMIEALPDAECACRTASPWSEAP